MSSNHAKSDVIPLQSAQRKCAWWKNTINFRAGPFWRQISKTHFSHEKEQSKWGKIAAKPVDKYGGQYVRFVFDLETAEEESKRSVVSIGKKDSQVSEATPWKLGTQLISC